MLSSTLIGNEIVGLDHRVGHAMLFEVD
jgi:hypothetical protein